MTNSLAQLEALARDPRLRVSPEQRPAIVAEILHHLMWPYFLGRRAAMRAQFDETQYRAFMQELADYCLRAYINPPEPRLTLDFIKGLHRQLYGNAPKMPVRNLQGQMATVVPGEFKTVPTYVPRGGVMVETLTPEKVHERMEYLLDTLHAAQAPLFQRYLHFMFAFTVIHPFPDSNGKLALALGDLYLLKQGIQPPYFAKYRWTHKADLYGLAERYAQGQSGLDELYPVLLGLYGSERYQTC